MNTNEMNAVKDTEKTETPAPRKKSATRRALVWGGAIVGALALLVLTGLWLVFSSERDFDAPQLGEPHYLFLRRLATEMRNSRKQKEATLRLSPDEAQQLMDIIRHSSQFVSARRPLPKPEHFQLEYRNDGGIGYSVPVKVMPEWCFGGTVYVTGVLLFSKFEREVKLDMPEFGVGRFDLPVPGGLDAVMPSWRRQAKRMLPDEFMAAFKSISAEPDGSVELVYRPLVLRRPLKKRLEQVQERCSDELRLPLEQLMRAL